MIGDRSPVNHTSGTRALTLGKTEDDRQRYQDVVYGA